MSDLRPGEAKPEGVVVPIKSPVALPVLHPYSGMDLASALAERAAALPDKTFLIWEPVPPAPSRSWTYRSFAHDVSRVAAGLHARGVRDGDAVMLLLENSPAFLMCLFACAQLGAVSVNTNTRYTADELDHAVSLTRPVGVITHASLEPSLGSIRERPGWIVTIDELSGTPRALFDASAPPPPRTPDPAAPLCIQFTSGTTSRPKAALFTHANALWGGQVGSSNVALRHDDTALVFAPLFHTGGLSWNFLSTFWAGGTVVLMPKFSATRFWEVSCKHRCTITFLVSVTLPALAKQEVPEHSYRAWICGAEIPEVEQRYGVRTFSGWGMTETVSEVLINHAVVRSEQFAIGRVTPGYAIKVLGDDGEPITPGEVGALYVQGSRGLSMFAEYYGDPDATNTAFDAAGYFDTGDLVALLPDGTIRFVSRAKDMLKVGGESVAAAEIERVLSAVPAVKEAAVVALPDPVYGEVPVAFITLRSNEDAATAPADALARCGRDLASFKVPRSVHVLAELPTAAMNKIAKGKLRELAVALDQR